RIQGCYIGTDATGKAKVGNSRFGVAVVLGSDNRIGGPAAGEGNVISGNEVGITLQDRGNVVQGNLIGTTATGNAALRTTEAGIWVIASGNTIGGTTPGAGNVISGNDGDAVHQSGDGIQLFQAGNLVQGNLIGTNQQGDAALANHGNGVHIYGWFGNTIGGT